MRLPKPDECDILGIIPGARIPVVDAVRGFAIFGILVVNAGSYFNALETSHSFWIALLFEGKFYPILSFLFGFGLFRQLSRGRGFAFRRAAVLGVFGLAHGFLIWTGDILVLYAITTVAVTIFFRTASPRTLLAWAVGLLAYPALLIGFLIPFAEMVKEETKKTVANERREVQTNRLLNTRAFTSPSYVEATKRRVAVYSENLSALTMFRTVLAMFLLGLRAGRLEWFDGDTSHFRKRLLYAAPIGLAASAYSASNGQWILQFETIDSRMFFHVAADAAASVFLSQAYIASVVLLGDWLRVLQAVGRMALTNYLLQSLLMTTLSYGYGFGLFGKVSSLAVFALAFGLFACQLWFSRLWLERFASGPMEWLWRRLGQGATSASTA
jgi:uncharacterized protein